MSEHSEFALSRVEAAGWNAARKYVTGGNPRDEKKIALLNPYQTDVERARWYTGFNRALERM